MTLQPKVYNTDEWIEENKTFFLPPVCNKMMHGETQMKCFFVGGPNIRKDYHVEEGPEFFYMVKGDMCLKIMEQDEPKDVVIKQGEVFLLPAKIPHSPQRQADTVGLVIERARLPTEMDCLRYFVEKDGNVTSDVLYEKWFHCKNLGPQLAAIINEYFETEQYKTGVPKPGTIMDENDTPFKANKTSKVDPPFLLDEWLDKNKGRIESTGSLDLFAGSGSDSFVKIYGPGEATGCVEEAEVFIWVLRGSAILEVGGEVYNLKIKDSMWLPINVSYKQKIEDQSSRVFVLYMNPRSKV